MSASFDTKAKWIKRGGIAGTIAGVVLVLIGIAARDIVIVVLGGVMGLMFEYRRRQLLRVIAERRHQPPAVKKSKAARPARSPRAAAAPAAPPRPVPPPKRKPKKRPKRK
jgi:hypothetical protein